MAAVAPIVAMLAAIATVIVTVIVIATVSARPFWRGLPVPPLVEGSEGAETVMTMTK